MLRILILIPFLVTTAKCADHNLFKDCSRVPFCTKFRNQEVDTPSQFKAITNAFRDTGNELFIALTNSNNENMELQLSFLEGNMLRIKFAEITPKQDRYELKDIIEKEPTRLLLTVEEGDVNMTITSIDNSQAKIVVIAGPPFVIQFYYDDQLQLILNGNRFIMEHDDNSQSFAFDLNFVTATKLYGLYHHAVDLALKQTTDGSSDPFRLRNSDTAGYEVASTMALYGNIPVIYGHSSNSTSGIFLHNAAEQWVDIDYRDDPSSYFMVESGALDMFVFLGPTLKEVVRQYTSLTGVAHLPQLWTLGYHQCRWSYYTQEDVKFIVASMDANNFPMDAIWLDIDYTDGKRYFTWNPANFSDPIELQRNISSTSRKLVTIMDPHIKVDDNYAVYTGAQKDYFVKWANGSNFEGDCWPGRSSYIDFLNPEASDYYASWYAYDKFIGSTETLAGFWNDMNEPSVFDDSLEKTLPFETVHHGGVLHRDVHNIYGFLQTRATHQGLMQRDNGTKRPFVLTRSHFAGSQRYAAMWTGDNTAGWDYLAVSYAECLISNLLGMVFCGADIGGFAGNPDVQLLQRWYQAGVWLPFYRGHAVEGSERREPYLFSNEVQEVIRSAMQTRYKHIPVWYTLFYEHTRYGDPIIRPFFYHYSENLEVQNQLLLGSDIMVRPVLEPDVSSVTVIFPGSGTQWFRVDDNSWTVHNGNTSEDVQVNISTSPVYYRAGSIISRRDRQRSSTTAMQDDPFNLYVNVDANNSAQGRIYVDDYSSFNYSTNSSYLYLNITFIPETFGLYFERIDGDGDPFNFLIQSIEIHTTEDDQKKVRRNSFTTTSDDTLLHTLDVAKQLKKKKGVLLPLKEIV